MHSLGRFLILLLVLLAIVLCVSTGVASDEADAATITVPTDYRTISEAITSANDGDTIKVLAGTYNEELRVDKPLTIIGDSSMGTIVRSVSSYCIRITANDVNVSFLRLEGSSSAAIHVGASGCVIENVDASRVAGGISIEKGGENVIQNCSLSEGSDFGLWLVDSSDNLVANVTIDSFFNGIDIGGGDNNVFVGCVVGDSSKYGCYVHPGNTAIPATNGSFEGLTIRGSLDFGFYYIGCDHLSISNSTFEDNQRYGIWGHHSSNLTVFGCHFERNRGSGLLLGTDTDTYRVENTTFYDHASSNGDGLTCYKSRNGYIVNCTMMKNQNGVAILGASDCIFHNNTIGWNERHGVEISFSPTEPDIIPVNITFTDTRVYECENGFMMRRGKAILVSNCTINDTYNGFSGDPGYVGTLLEDSSILGCTVRDNQWMGIYVNQLQACTIRDCTIVDNGNEGIFAAIGMMGNVISNNTISRNRNGVEVVFAGFLEISGNLVTDNEENGITLRGGYTLADLYIHNNTFSRNGVASTAQVAGLALAAVKDCLIENNLFAGSPNGLSLSHVPSSIVTRDNTFRRNTFRDNGGYGFLYGGGDAGPNAFYLNNFINNTAHVSGAHPQDAFDDGSLGNYWDDYTSKYPDAKVVGRVWDTPYEVVAITFDNYPLALAYDDSPPTAIAGEDQRVPAGTLVDLDGTASTDDQGIVNHTWSFSYDGSPVTLYGDRVSFTFLRIGTYDVTLEVRDVWDHSGSDTLVIEVYDDDPPVAEAGDDITVGMGEEFTLDGSASSDNGIIVSYVWTIDPDGPYITLEGVSAQTQIDGPGDYLVVLNVTDEAGLWAIDDLTLHVLDTEPPAADAGEDLEVDQGDLTTLDGSASTDNVGIVGWDWSFEHGGETVTLEGGAVDFVFTLAGTFVVTLNVSDATGNWDVDELTVVVRDTEPPVADAGPDIQADPGDSVTLDGSASTDNVGIVSHLWTFDDQGTPVTLQDVVVEHTFGSWGRYVVTLVVTDAEGNIDTDMVDVLVGDVTPPVAIAGDNVSLEAGDTASFDGSGSSDNVGIVGYEWTFTYLGSDRVLEGETAQFKFDAAGDYQVTLTVTDARGNSATDTLVVHVLPGERAWLLGPFTDKGGDSVPGVSVRVVLNGTTYTGTTDGDGNIELRVPVTDLVSPARVTTSKEGWRTLRFDMPLDANGDPSGDVPAMEREAEDSSNLAMWVAVIVVVVIFVAISVYLMGRRRPD